MAKASANLTLAVRDIANYYTAKGNFDGTVTNMTNALDSGGIIKSKGETCATVTAANDKITVAFSGSSTVCTKLKALDGITKMCGGSTTNNCEITVGGSSVSF